MNDELLFQRNPDYVYREIAGERILIPIGKTAMKYNGIASLNDTAFFLWELLSEKKAKPDLVGEFSQKYDISSEQSLEDVNEFLDMALGRGLVLRC